MFGPSVGPPCLKAWKGSNIQHRHCTARTRFPLVYNACGRGLLHTHRHTHTNIVVCQSHKYAHPHPNERVPFQPPGEMAEERREEGGGRRRRGSSSFQTSVHTSHRCRRRRHRRRRLECRQSGTRERSEGALLRCLVPPGCLEDKKKNATVLRGTQNTLVMTGSVSVGARVVCVGVCDWFSAMCVLLFVCVHERVHACVHG